MCIYPDCEICPNFNIKGATRGLYCADHKIEGMINVMSKNCIYPDCKKQPTFNLACNKKTLYCADHKIEGMINVKDKNCIYPGCKTIPCFNVEGAKKPMYCGEHKLIDMINVKDKTCIYKGCKTIPVFNIKGSKKALYCYDHKLSDMIDIKNKRCIYKGCETKPVFNIKGSKIGLYCSDHKLTDMINVLHKICKSEWCATQVQNKYHGYCLFCYMNMFPDKPVSRNYKTKEYSVVEYVKTKYPDVTWLSDKTIQNGCSKRRPDLLLDLGYQIIIIEIDENQHIDYDCSCENKRIMELSQDLGHRPIIFIRFNPDEYNCQGKKIGSCWGINKNGICLVKKSKQDEWTKRLEALENQIKYWINPENTTNKMIETIHLFYDV